MKKLFFLLLVVNLVIWLWGQREEPGRMTGTAQPDFGAIRVIDEAELARRREQAASQPQVASSVATAPAELAVRDETEPAAPDRTAVAAQPLAEPDAAPSAAEVSPQPTLSDRLATADLATTSTELAAAPPVAPMPATLPPPDDEAGATAPEAAPAASEPAEAPSSELSAATGIEVEPAPVPGPSIESNAWPPPPMGAEVGAAGAGPSAPEPDGAAGPSAPEPETAAVPAAPVAAGPSADIPEPPVDSTPSVPSAQVAASMPETVTTATDATAPEPAMSEEAVALESATSEVAPSEAPGAPLAQAEAIAPAEAAVPGEAAVATEPVSEAREVLYLCESLGPFRDRAAAARVSESLQAPLRAVRLREERVARTSRYWVLAPAQPDRQALAEYIGRLERAGVRDAWRIPSGPFAGRLAVGVFQAAANARKHADMLAAQGVAAEVHAPKDEERRYWIDYERPADADAPERAGERIRPAPQIVPRDCGRVAGP